MIKVILILTDELFEHYSSSLDTMEHFSNIELSDMGIENLLFKNYIILVPQRESFKLPTDKPIIHWEHFIRLKAFLDYNIYFNRKET